MGTITSGDRRLSTDEFRLRCARAATGLDRLGVKTGDGVAICLRNGLAFLEASGAVSMLGAFPVALNWHYTEQEARYILEDSGAKLLVIHADLLVGLRPVIPAGMTVLVVPVPPDVRQAYELSEDCGQVPQGLTNWEAWREGFEPRASAVLDIPSTIVYTSGTTGRPKGVRRSAMTPEQMAAVGGMLARSFGYQDYLNRPDEVVTAVVGPMYHTAPNMHANFSARIGVNVVIVPRFDAEELLALIQQHRITHLNLVPIMLNRLLKLPKVVRERYDLSSLRFVAHAAAPVSPPIKRAMIEWWGPVICEYYGSTEIGNVTFCTAEEWLAHPGTVGRAMPGATVRVVDASGAVVPPRTVGEVVAVNAGFPQFTYHGDAEKRRSVEKDGLIAPGDVGYLDEDGFLYLCDRATDMMISGGVNIYPAEIEAELHKMPEVADCAIFGIPDDDFGEAVCAVVQPQPGVKLTAEDVKSFLRQHVAGYKVPRRVDFNDALPREDSGKIFKRKLRAAYWEGAGRSI